MGEYSSLQWPPCIFNSSKMKLGSKNLLLPAIVERDNTVLLPLDIFIQCSCSTMSWESSQEQFHVRGKKTIRLHTWTQRSYYHLLEKTRKTSQLYQCWKMGTVLVRSSGKTWNGFMGNKVKSEKVTLQLSNTLPKRAGGLSLGGVFLFLKAVLFYKHF